jgi:hypothetical protein
MKTWLLPLCEPKIGLAELLAATISGNNQQQQTTVFLLLRPAFISRPFVAKRLGSIPPGRLAPANLAVSA